MHGTATDPALAQNGDDHDHSDDCDDRDGEDRDDHEILGQFDTADNLTPRTI